MVCAAADFTQVCGPETQENVKLITWHDFYIKAARFFGVFGFSSMEERYERH